MCARLLPIAAACFALAVPSQAYYHYVRFLTGAPYTAVPEAFDLNALPSKTVTFFVSDSGLSSYGPNDSFGSVLSQVKQAAAAWNSIASSDLRVAFGGLETYAANPSSTTPGGDVIFEELPPGLLGIGTPSVADSASVQTGTNGQFFPISRGLVILTSTTDPNATSHGPGPSYLEEFYTTAVHEFGHALGLQHTWTASAMSQDVIRNTSRARPLDADDIAAITELYGTAGWRSKTGSISGRVTASGQGWNLASVVAIPPVGPAVSALTNPDGTYTINGLPPGQYMLYAHPLPPDAVVANGSGLALPVDSSGHKLSPTTGYFQTTFYPGTTDLTKATTFAVAAGQSLTGENFAVQKRTTIPVYDLVTWTYLNPANRTYTYTSNYVWLTPAYSGTDQAYVTIYAYANSLDSTPVPSAATLLGSGTAAGQAEVFGSDIALFFRNQGGLTAGPRHLVLTYQTSQGTDLYVLPDAVTLVNNGPPTLNSAFAEGDGTVTLRGAGLTADSRFFFDGLQAGAVTPTASPDTVRVTPPQGASGQKATITAFSADNQNSMFLQPADPLTYSYPAANAPQIATLQPSALPAGFNASGTAAMVDITTTDTNFVDGQVTVGFGTSDVAVRRVWVVGPTHLVADVVVANNAAVGATTVNVISGFQVISRQAAFQIQPPNSDLPTPALPVYNAVNYATVLHDADYASVFGANLSMSPNGAQVLLNGKLTPVLYSSPSQINFQIPTDFPVGPATLQVNNGTTAAFPIYVQIDSPPAVINGPPSTAGAALSGLQATNPGDIITLQVTNSDADVVNSPSRVQVTLSGIPMTVLGVTATSSTSYEVQFAVTQSFAGWQVPLVVTVDGSPSLALQVTAH